MSDAVTKPVDVPPLVLYLFRSYVVVLALYAIDRLATAGVISMPVFALLSLGVSIPIAAVGVRLLGFRKAVEGIHLVEESFWSKLHGRRMLGVVGVVVASIVSAGALVSAVPTWTVVEWAAIVALIPVFLGVRALTNWALSKKWQQPKLEVRSAIWRTILVGVVAALCYILRAVLLEPDHPILSLGYLNALMLSRNGISHSSSLLLSDLAEINAHLSALRELVDANLAGGPAWLGVVVADAIPFAVALAGAVALFDFCLRPVSAYTVGLRTAAAPTRLGWGPTRGVEDGPAPRVRWILVAVIVATYLLTFALAFVADDAYTQSGGLQSATRWVGERIASLFDVA